MEEFERSIDIQILEEIVSAYKEQFNTLDEDDIRKIVSNNIENLSLAEQFLRELSNIKPEVQMKVDALKHMEELQSSITKGEDSGTRYVMDDLLYDPAIQNYVMAKIAEENARQK